MFAILINPKYPSITSTNIFAGYQAQEKKKIFARLRQRCFISDTSTARSNFEIQAGMIYKVFNYLGFTFVCNRTCLENYRWNWSCSGKSDPHLVKPFALSEKLSVKSEVELDCGVGESVRAAPYFW